DPPGARRLLPRAVGCGALRAGQPRGGIPVSRAVRTRSPLATDLALEVALVALSLATVGGFARLFDDGVFFWRIAGPVIVAHLLAAACRRLGLGILLSGLVSLAGMVVVIPAVL